MADGSLRQFVRKLLEAVAPGVAAAATAFLSDSPGRGAVVAVFGSLIASGVIAYLEFVHPRSREGEEPKVRAVGSRSVTIGGNVAGMVITSTANTGIIAESVVSIDERDKDKRKDSGSDGVGLDR